MARKRNPTKRLSEQQGRALVAAVEKYKTKWLTVIEEPQEPDVEACVVAVEALYRRMKYKNPPRVTMHDSFLEAFDLYLSMTDYNKHALPLVEERTNESPAVDIKTLISRAWHIFIELFESLVVSYPIRIDGKLKAYELEYVRRDLVGPGIERTLSRYDPGSRIETGLIHVAFVDNPLSNRLDMELSRANPGNHSNKGWFRHSAAHVSLVTYIRQCAIMDFFMHHPFPYRPPNQEHAVINCLFTLARNACMMICYQTHVFLVRLPAHIRFDEQLRLHYEAGPAVEYVDRTGTYAWHGNIIPDVWITEKDRPTAQEALQTENVELRRAAMEIVGWDAIIQQLDYSVIETDPDEEIGTLIEVRAPDIGMERERFLRVQCGTGRSFCLPVPPNIRTALEANAWTYDIDPSMLRDLEVRT